MSIKTLLRIIGGVSVAMVLGIALTLLLSVIETNRASRERSHLQKIITGVFDLNMLTHDFLLNPSERAAMQWDAQFENVSEFINDYPLQEMVNAPIYSRIRTNFLEMGQLFQQLLQNYPAEEQGRFTELQQGLIGQLLIESQNVRTEAARLYETKDRRLELIRDRTNFLIMGLVLITALIIIFDTLILNRFISKPIIHLFNGTQEIAAGDLKSKIRVGRTTSELKRLAASFNEMSSRLQTSYSQLRDEIRIRKNTEQELQKTLAGLEDKVRERTVELEDRNLALQQEIDLRHAKEEEARTERNRFYALLNSLPAYIFLMNRNHEIVFTNDLFEEQFGSPEGKSCQEILHCRSTACPSCHVDEVFETGMHSNREFEGLDGTWYQVYDYPFQDVDGNPLILELGIDITDRKRAQEALEKREQEYKALVENAPDVIARINRSFEYVYVNPAVEFMTGRPPSSFVGKTFTQIGFSHEVSTALRERITNVLSTMEIETFEHEVQTPAGMRYLHMRIAPEVTRHGQVETVLAITRDITPQKKLEQQLRMSHEVLETRVRERTAELQQTLLEKRKELEARERIQEALQESEEKFRLTFEQSPIGTALVDLDYRFLRVNDSLCAITGYSKEELEGLEFEQITHPEDIEQDMNLAQGLRSGDLPGYQMDKRYIHKDGSTVWVRLSASMMRDNQGRPLHYLAMVEDITERKQAEHALRRREQEYRALVENAPDMIARYDENMTILYVNPAVERYLGRKSSWFLGKNVREVINSPENLFRTVQAFESVLETGVGQVIEHEYKGLEGETRYFQTRLSPESVVEGKVKTILLISHDITHLKRLEQELREVSRAKSDFLANMSHELRTPISGILGITEMDLTRELPDDLRSDLELVKLAASSLIHIINDLLDLARIEARRIELDIQPFNPREMIREEVETFRPQAENKGLTLTYNISETVPENVKGDPNRLGQVLKNLLSNAIKFTEQGTIHVVANLEKREARKSTLLFSVTDTGIGIPQDKQNMLFQSFMQLDPSISKKYGGAGLGLVISKQLVEMMEGSIWVESAPGRGTTFSFTAVVERSLETKGPEEQKPIQGQLARIPPLRILLAEDNLVNQVFLSRFLRHSGHEVVTAGNGKEVLKQMRTREFDLVLMDIQMPEMDGLAATKKIREDTSGTMQRSIPIIALTAYAMKGDRERFLEAGMDDYVTKPVDFDILTQAILRSSAREHHLES